jgi:hypothetical protein
MSGTFDAERRQVKPSAFTDTRTGATGKPHQPSLKAVG